MFNGEQFWSQIDEISPYKTIFDFAKAVGMPYDTVRQQRHDKTIPRRPKDLLNIATTLDKSIEFLLTGEEKIGKKNPLSRRAEKIAWHCDNTASDEDLFIIERILDINSEYEITKKAVERNASSGIA